MFALYDSRSNTVESRHITYRAALKAQGKLFKRLKRYAKGFEKDFKIMREDSGGYLRDMTEEERMDMEILHGNLTKVKKY